MKARLRAWLEPKVRRQRARAVAADAVATNPNAAVERMMDDVVAAHNEQYHPGFGCAENERGQCFEAFGGTRAEGWAGEYTREERTT